MATKLQKHELSILLKKYGDVVPSDDGTSWTRVTLVGAINSNRYAVSRKVEYLAMKLIKEFVYNDMNRQVAIIESESSK